MSLKINEQIMNLRKQKGVTQGELADVLGVSNQSVSKWESGQCCPDIQLLPDIAKYFSVSIDELMGVLTPIKESEAKKKEENDPNVNDTLLMGAVELLGKNMIVSTAVLQRKMGIGYTKAKELIAEMQARGDIVEVKSGFYQAVRSQKDRLRLTVKNAVSGDREELLNTVLAMHAAWFMKMQKADSSADSAIEAVVGGQWGYSAFNEPDITTVMRGQSVFYSKNRALDFTGERIGKLCILLKTLSDRKNLTVLSTLYELTVHAENAYVGIDEIAEKSGIPQDTVRECLEDGLFPYILEQEMKYRIKGEDMAILPILSILCY